MEPLSWITIAQLAAKYGVPFVEHLFQNIKNNTPPTQEEWDKLKAKIATKYEDL